jgi:hypothetical protein
MMEIMKRWGAVGVWMAAASVAMLAGEPPRQASPQPSIAAVREAAARGQMDEAWTMLDSLPADEATVAVAVELALAPKTPLVAAPRLPFLADRTARLSLPSTEADRRLTACAIVVRLSADPPCQAQLDATRRGTGGNALDRARLWVTRRLLGEQPEVLPSGWETGITGSSALEVATWAELPAASRVRLLEPLLTSQDQGNVIAAMATLQGIPGAEALATWRRLSSQGAPTYPGARTQILVGLARHGDAESLAVIEPFQGQLSVSDRLVLAQGRAERRDVSGLQELVALVNVGAEPDAVRAAEAIGILGGSTAVEPRVRVWIRDGSRPLRERWLLAAARLHLGASPEVVRHLTSDDEAVRLAAAVAVAAAATARPPR